MPKLAPHAQVHVPHVQALLCVRLASPDMDYKTINALLLLIIQAQTQQMAQTS